MSQDAKPKHAWMVRAGNNNDLIEAVEKQSAIAIGWADLGNPASLLSALTAIGCACVLPQATR